MGHKQIFFSCNFSQPLKEIVGQMKEENKVLLGIVAELSVQLGVGQDIGPWLRIGKLMGVTL